ncbi:MAG: tRNA (adenosine(37)-N6)-threonylcarbamoyltransferase complex ATPase subunit type 1 TsaE [Bacteroidales bacterium]|nr:tRNA (adenosine(37)-N6)-threonylcarbamoyltransferase complex ATPase subunit type 1 TsaE [Bacteroidales bacterium]
MKHSITIANPGEIDEAAARFLKETAGRRFIAFYAPMGAGKTTFTSALCRAMGVDPKDISSPTFAIVNEYIASDGESIFHFDFYRIKRIEEALDLGFYDYIDSGALCIAEWPENIEPLIPEDALRVTIEVNPDSSRVLVWED